VSTELQRYSESPLPQRYTEPLDAEELKFLERKASKDRSNYFKVFQLLMLLSFIIPFAGAWYRAYDGAPNAFSLFKFFSAAGVLLTLSSVSTYIAYRTYLGKMHLDIKDKTKTIEKNHIMKKMYVGSRDTYHFYIDSAVKLSIEVSHADYLLMNVGDEVSIEYTTHAKEYLGYF